MRVESPGSREPETIRLGAVGFLNARPLVYGLEREPRFAIRFDVPSRCATLLHEGAIDLGLIPSIEYLRGEYRIVPDLAIASLGPVASVALYTSRPMSDVRSIAMDTSSRASIALLRVLCARLFGIRPALEMCAPNLDAMLRQCDAALIIGDIALALDGGPGVEKIDLGSAWTAMTGLPFVYAFWAGRPGALTSADAAALRAARDAGIEHPAEIAREYYSADPPLQEMGARYLRDNIKYHLGDQERSALELFFRYAADAGVVPSAGRVRFY